MAKCNFVFESEKEKEEVFYTIASGTTLCPHELKLCDYVQCELGDNCKECWENHIHCEIKENADDH